MATTYYVNTNAQPNGDHEVHTNACNWLPSAENRKYLGSFDSCAEAVEKAKTSYPTTANGCVHCSSACHTG